MTRRGLVQVALATAIGATVVVTLLPVAVMVAGSFKTNSEILASKYAFLPQTVQWGNYGEMWTAVSMATYLKNSLIVVGGSTVLALVIAVLAGYALARFRFPGSETYSLAVLATQVVPGVLFLLPLYLLFVQTELVFEVKIIDTYWGLIFTYGAFFVPFSIFILRSFFVSVPVSLEEQAMIDGCSRLQAIIHITLPLMAPGIAATAILIFLFAWDEVLFALVLAPTDATMTVPVGIKSFIGNYQNRYDLLMAAATAVSLPVVVLFSLMQRYIIRGLTAGAVKGER